MAVLHVDEIKASLVGEHGGVDVSGHQIVGNSSVLVRSEKSWHAVSRVAESSRCSRRSVTVTFYRPGSVSTMWPPGSQEH